MTSVSRGSRIANDIIRRDRRRTVPKRLQREASARPESKLVVTSSGEFWMSPIEVRLYEAMRSEGMDPIPQHCVRGYYVDFAFPDVKVAVEADGREFHSGERLELDKKRDWHIRREGWTVERFYGDRIYREAPECARILKMRVESRRREKLESERRASVERQMRSDREVSPLRKVLDFLLGRG